MIEDTGFMDKVTTAAVDMRTLLKFTNTKKQKIWLRAHPNFKLVPESGGKFRHVYDDVYAQWRMDVERNRNNVQQQDAEVSVEESVDNGETVSSDTGGDTEDSPV